MSLIEPPELREMTVPYHDLSDVVVTRNEDGDRIEFVFHWQQGTTNFVAVSPEIENNFVGFPRGWCMVKVGYDDSERFAFYERTNFPDNVAE